MRQPQSQRDTTVARQQLSDYRDGRTFYVFEKQCGTVRPLVENFANRADLMLGIDFRGDRMKLAGFLQLIEKLTQIHHNG